MQGGAKMSWGDAIFGYWGLPLMISLGSGIILGFWTLISCLSIWGIMYSYSFIKFSGKEVKRWK